MFRCHAIVARTDLSSILDNRDVATSGRRRPPWRAGAAALACAVSSLAPSGPALAQPAATPPAQAAAHGSIDPLEKLNRGFYAINRLVDRVVLRPFALAYLHVLPGPLRRGVHNVVHNLERPIVFANDVLQLRPKLAAKTAGRFVVNSTVGLGGLFDPASKAGLPEHDNDFGLTLARYGVTPGPYLVLPVLGPSSFRDALGMGVDAAADPTNHLHFRHGAAIGLAVEIAGGLDQRLEADADLSTIEQTSTDPYASLRALYLQDRERAAGAPPVSVETLPALDEPPAPSPGEAPPP